MIPQDKTDINTIKNNYFSQLPFLREEKTQKFMGIGLTIFALSFFGFFAINPTLSTIAKLRKEIKDNEFVNSQLEKKITDLNKLKILYSNLQNDLPIVFESLPKKADVPTLIAKIQSLALNNNLKITKIQNFDVEIVKSKKEKDAQYTSAFSITGDGTYEGISQFVSNLTNMQRIISINTLSIKRSQENNNQSIKFTIDAIALIKE